MIENDESMMPEQEPLTGKLIHDLRKLHNIRQQDLAAVVGISQSCLSLYEKEKQEIPEETGKRIGRVLGIYREEEPAGEERKNEGGEKKKAGGEWETETASLIEMEGREKNLDFPLELRMEATDKTSGVSLLREMEENEKNSNRNYLLVDERIERNSSNAIWTQNYLDIHKEVLIAQFTRNLQNIREMSFHELLNFEREAEAFCHQMAGSGSNTRQRSSLPVLFEKLPLMYSCELCKKEHGSCLRSQLETTDEVKSRELCETLLLEYIENIYRKNSQEN